jgi:hypothetical protein
MLSAPASRMCPFLSKIKDSRKELTEALSPQVNSSQADDISVFTADGLSDLFIFITPELAPRNLSMVAQSGSDGFRLLYPR